MLRDADGRAGIVQFEGDVMPFDPGGIGVPVTVTEFQVVQENEHTVRGLLQPLSVLSPDPFPWLPEDEYA